MKRALEEQYGGEEEVAELLWLCNCMVIILHGHYIAFNHVLTVSSCCHSYHRLTLDLTTHHSNLQNIRMHTCLFTYVKVTRRK